MSWLTRLLRPTEPPGRAEGRAPSIRASDPRGKPPERLTTLNFDRFVQAHPRVLIDVWAPWCGPCRAFAPVFAAAAEQWGGWVAFGKLHGDHEPSLVARWGVRSLPSLLFFRDGHLVRTEVGVVAPDRLAKLLRRVFRDPPDLRDRA